MDVSIPKLKLFSDSGNGIHKKIQFESLTKNDLEIPAYSGTPRGDRRNVLTDSRRSVKTKVFSQNRSVSHKILTAPQHKKYKRYVILDINLITL
jgi:hypothetical protein